MSSDTDRSREPSAGNRRSTLLVFCDSLAYYGPTGGLPSDDPRIWPNIVAGQLGWDVELIGRIGWTCRDVWWAATQDPRAWAALPRAGAVIFATGGMDSLPSPLPTALRELIRYVRPAWLRRWVRDGYGWAQPRLSPVARAALPPHVSVEYLELTRSAIDFNRPGIPIVASLPSGVVQADSMASRDSKYSSTIASHSGALRVPSSAGKLTTCRFSPGIRWANGACTSRK